VLTKLAPKAGCFNTSAQFANHKVIPAFLPSDLPNFSKPELNLQFSSVYIARFEYSF